MNKLTALLQFLLALFGLDLGGSTLVDRINIDGVEALYSRVTMQAGVARFECMRSATGQCHYLVFPRDCADGQGDSCMAEPIERFVLSQGDEHLVIGLHDFRPCVSNEAGNSKAGCRPQPMATGH